MELLIVLVVGLALLFDFYNGMNDAANSISTIVATRVLSPRWAVGWAALFNFIAFLFFGTEVAATIGKGIVDPAVVDPWLILAALSAAVLWVHLCTAVGLPISVSHTLIGGLAGAAAAKAGFGALIVPGISRVALFIVLSPVAGGLVAMLLSIAVAWTFRRASPGRVDRVFRLGQLLSSACYSLGHGANDAQKTMGIIAALLFSTGRLGPEFHVPLWVVLSCHGAIAAGTAIGGWRVVRTMGMQLTKLRPVNGFCAETSAALGLAGTALGGIPVSTTHTITGAVIGVGAAHNLAAVRWGVAGRIVWAWILTIPTSALIAAGCFWLIRALHPGV